MARQLAARPSRSPALKTLLLPLSRALTSRLVAAVESLAAAVDVLDAEVSQGSSATTALTARVDELTTRLTRAEGGLAEQRAAFARAGAGDEAGRPAEDRRPQAQVEQVEVLDAAGYLAFEDRFRGSREDILSRQREALEHVSGLRGAAAPLLDLGCGRGEWLELLREAGVPAFGVDSNASMVSAAEEHGLDVRLGDLVLFLEAVDEGSLGGVSGFHVAEHLPLPVLGRLLRAALRALEPGGVLLMETPNPMNLGVGSASFYLDPTHLRPVHPLFFQFLAEHTGFRDVQVRSVHPAAPELLLPAPAGDDPAERALHAVSSAVFGGQDYLLVAHRP